jgi:sugar phosphate isomerase/epimerase
MHGAFVDVLIFSYDEEIRAIARKRIIESMDIAKNIGAKAVIFHTNANPFLAYGEYKSRMINCTVEILREMLEQYSNINIYMENMFDSNPDILLEISEKLLEYDNYGVCFDYAHASISKTPVEKWIICLKRYIKHIHINDNDLINDLHLAVGDGKIDWEQFFTYYKKYFQDCTVLIETTSPKNQIRSVEFLKKHISIQ